MRNEELTYPQWVDRVDRLCVRLLSISVDELEECDLFSGYVEHETPEHFFVRCLVDTFLEDISVHDFESTIFLNALWGAP